MMSDLARRRLIEPSFPKKATRLPSTTEGGVVKIFTIGAAAENWGKAGIRLLRSTDSPWKLIKTNTTNSYSFENSTINVNELIQQEN